MLRRLRLVLPVRTALCLAALLSVTGSIGLHAEPSSAQGPHSLAAFGAAAPARARSFTHTCLICTLCGSVFPSSASFVVQGTVPSVSGLFIGQETRAESPVAPCHDGRAPPTVL
ncbi:MAG: hypothetical protein A2Y78_10295 [Acidobacteria bacterium RBG_13_68_16]|jgi:hypothetical protein|nr:MAG: hypothetical protein A2Y78_10295 [Acidobacteria bacterium RBG_13_68_16]